MDAKEKYLMTHSYEQIECYHCGHNMKINSRIVYKNKIFTTKCTKCKKMLTYDTSTFPLYLGYFQ